MESFKVTEILDVNSGLTYFEENPLLWVCNEKPAKYRKGSNAAGLLSYPGMMITKISNGKKTFCLDDDIISICGRFLIKKFILNNHGYPMICSSNDRIKIEPEEASHLHLLKDSIETVKTSQEPQKPEQPKFLKKSIHGIPKSIQIKGNETVIGGEKYYLHKYKDVMHLIPATNEYIYIKKEEIKPTQPEQSIGPNDKFPKLNVPYLCKEFRNNGGLTEITFTGRANKFLRIKQSGGDVWIEASSVGSEDGKKYQIISEIQNS